MSRLDFVLIFGIVTVLLLAPFLGDRIARMQHWYGREGRTLRLTHGRRRRCLPVVLWLAFVHGFLGLQERGRA